MKKIFRNKKTTFITVEIGNKCYDYPKDLPIPRIGETVSMTGSEFGKVTKVLYQIQDETFRMISIYTEII